MTHGDSVFAFARGEKGVSLVLATANVRGPIQGIPMLRSLIRRSLNRSPLLFDLRQRLPMFGHRWQASATLARRSWSQYGEDERLVAELGDMHESGFYVDVGAN